MWVTPPANTKRRLELWHRSQSGSRWKQFRRVRLSLLRTTKPWHPLNVLFGNSAGDGASTTSGLPAKITSVRRTHTEGSSLANSSDRNPAKHLCHQHRGAVRVSAAVKDGRAPDVRDADVIPDGGRARRRGARSRSKELNIKLPISFFVSDGRRIIQNRITTNGRRAWRVHWKGCALISKHSRYFLG